MIHFKLHLHGALFCMLFYSKPLSSIIWTDGIIYSLQMKTVALRQCMHLADSHVSVWTDRFDLEIESIPPSRKTPGLPFSRGCLGIWGTAPGSFITSEVRQCWWRLGPSHHTSSPGAYRLGDTGHTQWGKLSWCISEHECWANRLRRGKVLRKFSCSSLRTPYNNTSWILLESSVK